MHAIALRRIALIPSALLVMLGLTFAPAVTPSAAASVNYVEICVSGDSTPGTKIWVYNSVFPNGYALFPGMNSCTLFRRTNIKVEIEGPNWQVRSVPGTFGRCWASQWSYPASKDKYSYRIGCP